MTKAFMHARRLRTSADCATNQSSLSRQSRTSASTVSSTQISATGGVRTKSMSLACNICH